MQGLALPSGLSSCFSTSAEGICRAPTPNSTRSGPAMRGLCCISNSNPSLNSPCSSLPELGMCRGSTESWLVALILYAESLSVSLLLFHFPFLPLRPWGCRAGQKLLCQPRSRLKSPRGVWSPGDAALPGLCPAGPQGTAWIRINSLFGNLWARGGHFEAISSFG